MRTKAEKEKYPKSDVLKEQEDRNKATEEKAIVETENKDVKEYERVNSQGSNPGSKQRNHDIKKGDLEIIIEDKEKYSNNLANKGTETASVRNQNHQDKVSNIGKETETTSLIQGQYANNNLRNKLNQVSDLKKGKNNYLKANKHLEPTSDKQDKEIELDNIHVEFKN